MAIDKIEDEHHAILFLYKADSRRYGKQIEQMENDLLQNDLFPKSVADACRILAGWKSQHGNWNKIFTDANDGVGVCDQGWWKQQEIK